MNLITSGGQQPSLVRIDAQEFRIFATAKKLCVGLQDNMIYMGKPGDDDLRRPVQTEGSTGTNTCILEVTAHSIHSDELSFGVNPT